MIESLSIVFYMYYLCKGVNILKYLLQRTGGGGGFTGGGSSTVLYGMLLQGWVTTLKRATAKQENGFSILERA